MSDDAEEIVKTFVKNALADGVRFAASMARDMAEKMLAGELPNTSGPASLQLLAVMLDRLDTDDMPCAISAYVTSLLRQ